MPERARRAVELRRPDRRRRSTSAPSARRCGVRSGAAVERVSRDGRAAPAGRQRHARARCARCPGRGRQRGSSARSTHLPDDARTATPTSARPIASRRSLPLSSAPRAALARARGRRRPRCAGRLRRLQPRAPARPRHGRRRLRAPATTGGDGRRRLDRRRRSGLRPGCAGTRRGGASRLRDGCRRRRGRRRRVGGTPAAGERERVDVAVLVARDANAEVDVRRRAPASPLGPTRADAAPSSTRRRACTERAEMGERHRVAVGGLDRHAQPVRRHRARERDRRPTRAHATLRRSPSATSMPRCCPPA